MIDSLNTFPPLIPGEVDLLLAINRAHHPVLDAFMYMISNSLVWIPLVAVLLYYLFAKKPWQEGLILIFCIALCILCCDQISSGFAKPFFSRFRPTHMLGIQEHLHLVYNYRGASYGFFSGHASNFFAVAFLLSRTIRQRIVSVLLFTIVAVVAYSRMYQGVHFFSDILVGIIVGLVVGYLIGFVQDWLRLRLSPVGKLSLQEVFSPYYKLLLISLGAFIPILLVYSIQIAKILRYLH